jgi:ribosomal-protein-alanine acetyltransferase
VVAALALARLNDGRGLNILLEEMANPLGIERTEGVKSIWFQDQHLLGYLVAMRGADELHLLNITVAPGFQRRGWGSHILQTLIGWARERGVHAIWLEVRASNHAGISLYQAHGFDLQGERKNYYPLSSHQREDAVVMGLQW